VTRSNSSSRHPATAPTDGGQTSMSSLMTCIKRSRSHRRRGSPAEGAEEVEGAGADGGLVGGKAAGLRR
jgi:hypothetical protein